MPIHVRSTIAAFALLLLSAAPVWSAEAKPSAEQLRFFEAKIRPLLVDKCYKCHGPEKQRGGLRLDAMAFMTKGGETGPAVTPGKPDESLLVEAINYESFEMPPTGKLDEKEIALLTDWVKMGAPWPQETPPAHVAEQPKISDEDRDWWAFRPVRKPTLPDVDDGGWSKNEIDRFVFRKLQQAGLKPAPEAQRRALVRRAYYDLHGLPPTPKEIADFLADDDPLAYERLIDRLLESPRYGERWARHWLDVVRYAESDGFREDAYRAHAWRYRDYVIGALNDDISYDRFVQEQLAGDEIAPDDPSAIAATGFLRLWIYEHNQRDVHGQWGDIINDVTDVTGDVFLAMGMGCARCHDHKFDPLLKKDYFALRAFFAPLVPRDDIPLGDAQQKAQYEQELARWEAETADVRESIDNLERPHLAALAESAITKFPKDVQAMIRKPRAERDPYEEQIAHLAWRQVAREQAKIDTKFKGKEKERRDALLKQLAEFKKPKPLPTVYTVTDVGAEPPPTVMPGDSREQDIEPSFLTVLSDSPPEILPPPHVSQTSGRRTALARWITRPDNPLATRVIVNRIWQHHFGQGLVATASDFGHLGQPPSHPELLDWLTAWFVDGDWKFKRLHKLIMTSAAYRQSALSEPLKQALLSDPENRLLWRMNVRRLSSDQIRDAALYVTGELDLKMGGASVASSAARRTVYLKVYRNSRQPLLDVFDTPDGYFSVSERNVTTTPTQSLLMINGPWVLARAKALAQRLDKLQVKNDRQRVKHAFRLVLGRGATPDELALADNFLSTQTAAAEPKKDAKQQEGDRRLAALVDFCHVLLNSNEFLYTD